MYCRLTVAVIGCVAALALAGAPTALGHASDIGCNGNDKDPHGIYKNPTASEGTFNFSSQPKTALANAKQNASALLCGTDEFAGDFFGKIGASATITYPGKGEFVTCARENPELALGYCDKNGNGAVNGNENIESGSYLGYSQSDSFCGSLLCFFQPAYDTPANTYAATEADGNSHCDDTSTNQVACEQSVAYVDLLGDGSIIYTCKTDIIISKGGSGKYKMAIYEPACETPTGYPVEPVYVTNMDSIVVCKKAGAVGGTACDTTSKPVFYNGNAGSYKFTLSVPTTNPSGLLTDPETANGQGNWT